MGAQFIHRDQLGVYSVGEVEVGLNFQHYGMLGIDDRFTFYGIAAHGNRNYNFAYDIPVNPWSGRAGVSFSAGSIAVYKGAYRDLDIDGSALELYESSAAVVRDRSSYDQLRPAVHHVRP